MNNEETGDVDASAPADEWSDSESRSQVRGSSLLLSGRVLAMAINYLTTILIIRYLAKSDYGAFAYALSMVAVGKAAVQLGLDRGLSRYLPIYDERSDTGSILGAITFAASVAIGLGALVAVGFLAGRSIVEGTLITDPLAVSVLAVMIWLAPVDGLDNLVVTILAAFRQTGAIFLRRYVVAPVLKLAVVLMLIGTGSGVEFLAVGYTAAGILGLAIFGWAMGRLLIARRASDPTTPVRLRIRELTTFSLPLLTTDLVFMALNATDAAMLEWFGSTSDVAAIRAVQPTARLNQVVLEAFGILYIPYIARLYARGRHEDLGRRYWQTANWVVVLSLPVLAACLLFPNELTSSLLGEEYAESAVILGVLSAGYFTHAVFGFNGMTLNVYRKVRFLVVVNVLAVVANVAINLALIPSLGPLGAAIGTTGTFIIHNIAKQYGLIRKAGLSGAPGETTRLYLAVAGLVTVAAIVGYGTDLGLVARIGLWALVGIGAVAVARKTLHIEDAFPELTRFKLIRYLFR